MLEEMRAAGYPPAMEASQVLTKVILLTFDSMCSDWVVFQWSIVLAWRPGLEACHGEGISNSATKGRRTLNMDCVGRAMHVLGITRSDYALLPSCTLSNFTKACFSGTVSSWQILCGRIRSGFLRLLQNVSAHSAQCPLPGCKKLPFLSKVCSERPIALSDFCASVHAVCRECAGPGV